MCLLLFSSRGGTVNVFASAVQGTPSPSSGIHLVVGHRAGKIFLGTKRCPACPGQACDALAVGAVVTASGWVELFSGLSERHFPRLVGLV